MNTKPASLAFGTKLSRVITAFLIIGYVTQLLVPSSRQYLALVAGRFIPCVWNIFTAGLLETRIIQLAINSAALLVLSSIIEPLWGAKEFAKFLALTNLISGVVSLAILYLAFAATYTGTILWLEVSGAQGSIAACLVAIKNLIPDTEITLLRVIIFQAKHLPGLYVVVSTVTYLALGAGITKVPQLLAGAYGAWFYLRVIQVKQGLNLRGDPSTEFSFASFFPGFLQGPVDKLSAVCARVFRMQISDPSSSNTAYALQGKPLPGSDNLEAARRRERGAKVLEERLKASKSQSGQVDIEAPAPSPEISSSGTEQQ